MFSILTKKRLTEQAVAKKFTTSMLQLVDQGFPEVASLINEDSCFEKSPGITADMWDKFLLVVLAGNLKYIPDYFSSYQDARLIDKIYSELSNELGCTKEDIKKTIASYQSFMSRVNHPSKNTHYAMSKAVFHKYNLTAFQDEYFRKMNSPNPIFLKQLDEIISSFIWDWASFLEKFRVTE